VVESDANIKVSARRVAMAKFSNAGQMCVAPDYVLIHDSRKNDFIVALKDCIQKFFTADPANSYNYGKIINEKTFNRLINYIKQGDVISGGKYDAATHFIEPTILENIPIDATVMGEEIFGPVLPIISFTSFEEAKNIIQKNANPLAFYVFTESEEKEKKWLKEIAFGGGCVNNASWHLTNPHLPFGGRGNSGIGAYHGKESFHVFSHRKSVMKTPTWLDPSIKYPPFNGKLKLFKKIIK
jgi:aldehyde dehydrogenase (NAD+)